jgi:hypothetical protein
MLYRIAKMAFAVLMTSGLDAAAQQATPPLPAVQETIYNGEATSILGRLVLGPDTKSVGRIVDVLVDDSGQPRAAVIDMGGFMGIGNRRIAVVWRALHFTADPNGQGSISLEMTVDQIKATPEYKPTGNPMTVAAPPQPGQGQP